LYEIKRSRPLQVLLTVNFVQGLALGFWGFLSYMLLDLGGTAIDLGLLSLLPGLISTFMQLAWGRVADRVPNSQRLVAYGYLVQALLRIPSRFAAAPWMVYGGQMIMVLFSSVLQVVPLLMLTQHLKPDHRASFLGVYNPMSYVGNIIGSFLAGQMIPVVGYRYTLLCYSGLNLVTAMIVWFVLPGTQEPCAVGFWGLMRDGFRELPAGLKNLPAVIREGGSYTKWVLGISVRGFGLAIFGPVITYYVGKVINAPTPLIGSLTSLSFVVRLISSPILGWIAERRGANPVMLLGVTLAMIHPFILCYSGTAEFLAVAYSVAGLYWSCINTSWIAWQMNLIPRKRGVYSGLLNFMNGLEWAVAPMVGGVMTEAAPILYSAGLSSVFLLAGFILLLRVPEKT